MNKLDAQSRFGDVFAWQFMEMISDAFFVFDYSLHFIFVNNKAARLTGKTKKELLGKEVSEVFPEVKVKAIYIDFLKSKKFSKKPIEYYSPSMRKWLTVSVYPTKYGIAVSARDITDQKIAEDAARESQEILNAFFENSPVGLAIYDEEMRFLKLDNASAKIFFGKKAKDVVGKSLQALSPANAEKVVNIFQEVLKNNKPAISEVSVKDELGNTLVGLSSRFPLQFANGKRGVGTVTVDITERYQNEQRKDEFIAMASHELKTPLTSAKIFTQVLQRRFNLLRDEESSNLLARVNMKIDQLEALIKELLDAILTNKKELSLKKDRFLLKTLALQTISELQLSIKNKIIVDWTTKDYVYADKERVSQILINFIANAAKYSPDNNDIIIHSRKKGNFIIVSVQDFGIGISQEDQPYIFDRFYQSSRHNTYPGLGLGLYIARKIVTENNGQIWVESEEGKGSIFYFSLPVSKKAT